MSASDVGLFVKDKEALFIGSATHGQEYRASEGEGRLYPRGMQDIAVGMSTIIRFFAHHEAQAYEGDNDDKEQDDRHRGNGDAKGGAQGVCRECEDYGGFLRSCFFVMCFRGGDYSILRT